MSRKCKGMVSFEMMQALAIVLFVLFLILSSSFRIGVLLGNAEETLGSEMLALQIAGRLDSFQRNACGTGFCHTVFTISKPPGYSLQFLSDSVVVSTDSHNATARTAFPLDALEITVDGVNGSARISASG